MSGTATADQVPGRYDVIVDGFGYITARAVDPNLPFRVQQQMLSYTPTFLERTNVSGNYGDDAQAFFLTASQNNWSGGGGQRFFRSTDSDSVSRYFRGDTADTSVQGQTKITYPVGGFATADSVRGIVGSPLGQQCIFVSNTNLYGVNNQGGLTNLGAHGLGTPNINEQAITADEFAVYISSTSAGTVGVRRYDVNGAAYTTFSATGVDAVEFLPNANTLYGFILSTGQLVNFSTVGVTAVLNTWKGANGTGVSNMNSVVLRAFGNKLLILIVFHDGHGQLYQYDGTSTTLVSEFPQGFRPQRMTTIFGSVACIMGTFPDGKNAILTYTTGGTIAIIWRGTSSGGASGGCGSLAAFNDGIAFTDINSQDGPVLCYYDFATGAIATLGLIAAGTASALEGAGPMAACTTAGSFLPCVAFGSTPSVKVYTWPSNNTLSSATSGIIYSSLFDFDNSLTKLMRGIKVDFIPGTNGDGGSVDIAYQLDSLDGSYTNLRTAAVSGTEYLLTNVTGHAISVRVTLNKGTSTYGPTLKRVYVRGVPLLQAFRVNEYIFDLGGDATGQDPVVLRDGLTPHSLTGEQQRVNLLAALTSTTPVSVTDRTGTFTAVLEPANCEFDLTRPGQWYARIRVREV